MTTQETSTTAAIAEHNAGRFDQAQTIYRNRLAQSPDELVTLIGLGDVLTDAGQPAQALEFYRRAIAIDPESTENSGAYDGLAAILQDMGDLDNAVIASKKAAVLRGSADDAFAVGHSLEYLGRIHDAIDMFQLAAKLKPEFYEAHAKAGHHLLTLGQARESIPHYQAAVQAKPEVAELHCNLANARRQSGETNDALNSARRAIELKPELPEAHNVMGAIWKDRRRWSDALTALGRAVQLKPDAADALNNTGTVLEAVGRHIEATAYFDRAVKLRSDVLEFHHNLAVNLLTRGDWARGWEELEWRRMDPAHSAGRLFDKPAWDGSDLHGRTIFVHAEAPISRSIQFLRYLPVLQQLGAQIVLECQPALAGVARRIAGVVEVIHQGDPLPAFDCHFPLISLAKVFRTTPTYMPGNVPYLFADAEKSAEWAKKLPQTPARHRIGLTWPEATTVSKERDRNCPPDKLAALSALPDTQFFVLQSPAPSLPADLNLIDLSSDLKDLDDTAALIQNLDAVIGCDTAVANLAAAMGKPTYLLLPSVADWRWMLDRDDSPWYPTARLFRQSPDRGWSPTVETLTATCKAALASPHL